MAFVKRPEQPPSPGIADPGAMDIDEACVYLRKGHDALWQAIGAGHIRYYRVGRRVLIPYRELVAYQDRLVQETMRAEHGREGVPHERTAT